MPPPTPSTPLPNRDVYSVSRLNQEVRALLEMRFPLIWLEGEISNLARPASGHCYFSLKDAGAQVQCALFRQRAVLVRDPLRNGQQVLVRARISLYEPRGSFQLIIEHLEDAGTGALWRAYEALRWRLEQEGLFATARKRPLPRLPRRLGVITAPTGAALRDVLSVLRRRFPALPILLYPTAVQGDGAAEQIAQTIDLAGQRRECDLLLLTRGGGSLEDLWAFNEERVARAIVASPIPIVCGVGHETDVSIADFAADLRAPTPSAAAELISPDRQEWQAQFAALQTRLTTALRRRLADLRQRLNWLEQNLARRQPGRRLLERAQRLDELEQRLQQALYRRLERLRLRLTGLDTRLRAHTPIPRIRQAEHHRQALAQRLETAMQHRLDHAAQQLGSAARALHAVSPLQTLERGYALVQRQSDGEIIRRAAQLQPGEKIEAVLSEGRLLCRVETVQK